MPAPLEITQFVGFPDGMNTAKEPHELAVTEARYLQDILLDQAGITPRRGPVKPVSGVATFSNPAIGITQALTRGGTNRIAVLEGDGSNAYLSVLSANHASATQIPWTGTFSNDYSFIVDAKPALTGGVWIGTTDQYESTATTQRLALWKGSEKPNYSTGTVTVSRGNKTVTGSGTAFLANVDAGMFLFDSNNYLIGEVRQVESNTQLKLEQGALRAMTGAAYTLKPIRGFQARISTGRITTATDKKAVNGANTKFQDQDISSDWALYRAKDMKFIGDVDTVKSNIRLNLVANAAIETDNERYFLIREDNSDYTLLTGVDAAKVGFLSAVYANRQFFANRADANDVDKLWYSDGHDPESVDLSTVDGSFIRVRTAGTGKGSATPIKAIVPTSNALLVLKGNETFALFGDTPDNFELKRIHNDGVISGMTAQSYRDGVIYAGRDGIYFFDGTEVNNISEEKLGDFYTDCIKSFNPTTHRMWGMVVEEHYFLHIESVTSPIELIRGSEGTTVTRMTLALHLPTQAYTVLTNLDFRGSIALPLQEGQGTWYIVNTSAGARICSTRALFEEEGLDTITCTGNTAGPAWYIETPKYSADENVRKKLWKGFTAHYQVSGGTISADILVGLSNPAAAQRTILLPDTDYTWETFGKAFPSWDDAGVLYDSWDDIVGTRWGIKRRKFAKRAHHIGFRFYETTASEASKVRLGPFMTAFKRMARLKV
jgi:hypothetical protein